MAKMGQGGWRIVENSSSPAIGKVTLMQKADMDKKYDVLQIDTSKDEVKGVTTIWLKDRAGNDAFIAIKVQ